MSARRARYSRRNVTAADARLPAVGAALVIVAMLVAATTSRAEAADSEPWSPRASEPWTPFPSAPWSPSASEAWSPYRSSTWTPPDADHAVVDRRPLYVATLANDDLLRVDQPAAVDNSFFAAPPPVPDGSEYPAGPADADYGIGPPCDGWQVHSHFMPMLGRFGVVAPRTPGVDSVHSPFGATSPQWPPQPCDAESYQGPGPVIDPRSRFTGYSSADFTPDPFFDHIPWDSWAEQGVYGGKYLNPVQRPLVEWGMPLYLNGPVPPPTLEFGVTNPSVKRFYVYGDYRAAAAYNAQKGSDLGVLAHRLNLELDYWMTATERLHAFIGPLQEGGSFDRLEFDDGEVQHREALDLFDEDTDTLFFEGDLGAIIGGISGTYAPFDMPIAAGLIPLLFQNGVWMEDALLGMAMTIPARNSPMLDWSNFDVTFFYAVDELDSPAFGTNDSANVFGATTFIEAKGGYLEAGYAFLEHNAVPGCSYHNVGVSYTRRYLNLMSNSMRVIVNAGQDGPEEDRTANGVLFLVENSFLTRWPYNVIPYVNAFVGVDDPQSVARAGAAGGVLRNTGILFESDNLTGYPTLDATGNDTYGAAIGVDLLAHDFSQQLILEAAVLQAYGDPALRNAPGDQYGIGARYQIPISHRYLLRFDVMHGWLENTDDVTGARTEFRWKF